MKFDLQGRLRNLRHPDPRTAIMFSIFEAVSNSMNAIEAAFGENSAQRGSIDISVELDSETGELFAVSVSDNGVGLSPERLEAFDTCDTMFNAAKGGKGIGRLVWFIVYDDIEVRSSYTEMEETKSLRFDFRPSQDESIANFGWTEGSARGPGTLIRLSSPKTDFQHRIRKRTVLNDLAAHFLPYFLEGDMPRLHLYFDGATESINEIIDKSVQSSLSDSAFFTDIDGQKVELKIQHVFANKKIASKLNNTIVLVANNRVVQANDIERKFALNQLEKNSYFAVVTSPFLDKSADQERTELKIGQESLARMDSSIFAAIDKFLEDHLKTLKQEQKKNVEQIISNYPQLASSVVSAEEYIKKLPAYMDREQIGQNLFIEHMRHERRIRKEIESVARVVQDKTVADDEIRAAEDRAIKLGESLDRQLKGRLSEYVLKRHEIIQLFLQFLEYKDSDEKNYRLEKVVHNLICPLGRFYEGQWDYHRHNLWLIDDLLTFYQFFCSDKQIKTFTTESESQKEPDLVFFNPLGYRADERTDTVVILEFKRPGKNKPSGDPIKQVLDYARGIRDGKAVNHNGKIISSFSETTRFDCTIICDMDSATRDYFENSLANNKTPDGNGYYGYSQNPSAIIKGVSFEKVIRDCNARNKAFFDLLNLKPVSFD